MAEEPRTADETAGASWPRWSRQNGYEALAHYVSVPSIEGLGLIEVQAEQWRRAGALVDANRSTVEALYERLADKAYSYRVEPWSVTDGQHIRDARWIDRSGGTCLDLAVLFATMCTEAGIASLIAIGEEPLKGGVPHAFVLVDLARKWDSGVLPEPRSGFDGGVAKFVGGLPAGLNEAIWAETLVALDPTEASGHYKGDIDAALGSDRARFDRFGRLVLVDVQYLHAHGTDPLPPVRSVPAISRLLPPFPRFTHYSSRAVLGKDVAGAAGRLVLWGAQGTGKSMLAHHLAAATDDGCGWFLTATDASTLITELANAYAREESQPSVSLDDATRKEYAAAAVARLNDASEPWVVVLDNANGDPAELAPWLPAPSRERGQLLMVTTTNPEWRHAPRFRAREVGPLSDEDVYGDVGDPRLVSLSLGRPLLARSFGRLLETSGDPEVFGDLGEGGGEVDEADGPRVLWQTASALLGEDALETAWLLAWLPPDRVPWDVLVDLRGGADPRLAELESFGLVTFRRGDDATDLVSIHRLYVDAIREELRRRPAALQSAVVAVLEHPAGFRFLDEYGDQATVEAIVRQLRNDYRAAPAGGVLASALRSAARLQELHGRIRASAETYRVVADRLRDELGPYLDEVDAADPPAPLDDYDVLADCLHGWARYPFQQAKHDRSALEGALADGELAVRLKEGVGDKLGTARSRALVGLIRRALASFLDGPQRLAELKEALEVIEQSAREREEMLDDHPEVARSIFNLGGSRVRLAKEDKPDRIPYHLDQAQSAYQRTLDMRTRLLRRKEHPHIAACRNGLALVAYFRAVLQPGLSYDQAVDCLRTATYNAQEALQVRQDLDGPYDGSDSAKSMALLSKILLARYELAQADGRATDVVKDADAEIAKMALVRATS